MVQLTKPDPPCTDNPVCLNAITLSGSTRVPQDMGMYAYYASSGGRPAYKKEGGKFLYWNPSYGQWMVSVVLGEVVDVKINADEDALSPDLVSMWNTHDGAWEADNAVSAAVSAVCDDLCCTVTSVRIPPASGENYLFKISYFTHNPHIPNSIHHHTTTM